MAYSRSYALLLLFELALLGASKNTTNNIQFTMQLIEEGQRRIEIGKYDDIVLTLGNTGSGKTTLINFLAGDNSKLIAKKFGNSIIIQDTSNKISRVEDTIVSKTLFPELIYDSSSGTAYYDCSGFSDTRNSSIDIASNYFIHKIIESIQRIKILFVVNYSSVTSGNDRQDFMVVLKHATDLMKNLKEIDGSIALIITKVENVVRDGRNYRLQSDEEEINQIAKFLTTMKSAIEKLQLTENNEEKMVFYEKALNLIEIFTFNVNGTYPNIGIFRKPDQEGVLSEIELMKENRIVLKEMIEYRLIYSTVHSEDFGYTVSANSRNYIHDLILEMNDKFNYETNEFIEKIISHCYDKEKTGLKDLDSFKRELVELTDANQRIFDNFNEEFLAELFLTEITQLFHKFGIQLPQENLNNIELYHNFLNFLNKVNSEPLNINSGYIMQKWKRNLEKLIDLKNIYVFLSNLYGKLSEYKIQKIKEDFDVATLKQEIANDVGDNISINRNHFNEIVNQIYSDEIKGDYNLDSINNIRNSSFSKIQVQLLMKILEITLTPSTSIKCYDQKLIVSGENVLLSQILNKCSDWTFLKIYATNKVFIDEDIIKIGKFVRVIIIAPVWEIIDKRQIILTGTIADTHDYLNNWLGQGENGKPGKPGFCGGSMFGIGYAFTNSKNLFITSKGGDGGTGQDGSDGEAGRDGFPLSMREVDSKMMITLIWNKYDVYYKQYHTSGLDGGRGGHGGVGGEPGKAGEIQIIGLKEQPNFELKFVKGKRGNGGVGGAGGLGGLGDYTCKLVHYDRDILLITYKQHLEELSCERAKRGKSGDRGRPGFNYKNITEPEINNIKDKESYVNEFNNLISSDLNDPIKSTKLLKYLEQMYSKDGTFRLYEDLYNGLLKLQEE